MSWAGADRSFLFALLCEGWVDVDAISLRVWFEKFENSMRGKLLLLIFLVLLCMGAFIFTCDDWENESFWLPSSLDRLELFRLVSSLFTLLAVAAWVLLETYTEFNTMNYWKCWEKKFVHTFLLRSDRFAPLFASIVFLFQIKLNVNCPVNLISLLWSMISMWSTDFFFSIFLLVIPTNITKYSQYSRKIYSRFAFVFASHE